MTLEVNATLIFGGPPHDETITQHVIDLKNYYHQLFFGIGFDFALLDTTVYNAADGLLPEAAALDVQLKAEATEFPTLYNLLKIAEASLLLFPYKVSVDNFRYSMA